MKQILSHISYETSKKEEKVIRFKNFRISYNCPAKNQSFNRPSNLTFFYTHSEVSERLLVII
jgi:hypothetical protein